MMKTILKWTLPVQKGFVLELPKGARILSVQAQNDKMCMWTISDRDAPMEPRYFLFMPTGASFDDTTMLYQCTCQASAFVWHLFETTKEHLGQ